MVVAVDSNLQVLLLALGSGSDASLAGDGVLSSVGGFEGNANTVHWPGLDATPANGVTGADGSGFRGGSWSDTNNLLKISDRSEAALRLTAAASNVGGRGVRTYDGN